MARDNRPDTVAAHFKRKGKFLRRTVEAVDPSRLLAGVGIFNHGESPMRETFHTRLMLSLVRVWKIWLRADNFFFGPCVASVPAENS